MKRLLAMILALLLAVPLPVYAGATPSDADYFNDSKIIGTGPNSVNRAYLTVAVKGTYQSGAYFYKEGTINNSGRFSVTIPAGVICQRLLFIFPTRALPFDGSYSFRATLTMDNTPTSNNMWVGNRSELNGQVIQENASLQNNMYNPEYPDVDIITIPGAPSTSMYSGVAGSVSSNAASDLTAVYKSIGVTRNPSVRLIWYAVMKPIQPNRNITLNGNAYFQFEKVSTKPTYTMPLYNPSNSPGSTDAAISDIQDAVNQIPDKIGDVADAVQDVVQGIANLPQNIAGALEPHYDNILQQLHHITEQLHALWDQLAAYFNDKLIPQMITDTNRIVEAIEAINLEVNVDFDALKQQLAQQHKEQMDNDNKNTEEIVNGYENGDMDSISGQFGTAAENSDNAEDQLFNEVSGNISDFTFNLEILSKYQTSLDIIGTILRHFVALPFVKTPMVFMLTLSIALLMIGYYRFKGGG